MAGEDQGAATAPEETASEPIWPMVVTLEKPVQAHGDMVKELSFREPTGGDIEKAGFPLEFDFQQEPPGISINEKKMGALMSLLAKVPPTTIKALAPKDWSTCAWGIAGFFTPRQAV